MRHSGTKAKCGIKWLQKRQTVAREGRVRHAMAAEEAEGKQMSLILTIQQEEYTKKVERSNKLNEGN